MVNIFDQAILSAVNSVAGESFLFDHAMGYIATSDLVKGVPFVCLLWSYWFRVGTAEGVRGVRAHVICGLAAGVVAIVLGRILALTLPFRVRPRYDPNVHFHIPASWQPMDLTDWSSFPSDHAALFSALATSLIFISRGVGAGALIYVALLIGFPRIYLGYHYPSDVLGGMLLGVALGYLCNGTAVREALTRKWQHLEAVAPAVFYPLLFILCEQLATMFDGTLRTAYTLNNAIHYLWGG